MIRLIPLLLALYWPIGTDLGNLKFKLILGSKTFSVKKELCQKIVPPIHLGKGSKIKLIFLGEFSRNGGGGTVGSDVTLCENWSVFIRCSTMPVGALLAL